jgi:LysM repeat protein
VHRRLPLLAAILAALALAPSAAAVNPQIAGLQVALRERGLYRGAIDGVQGPRTKTAIRAFQRRRGLTVDGLAGPRTRRALGRLGRPVFGTRVLRRGAVGYDVAVLQFLLRRAGYRPGRLDGRFGPRTRLVLRRFQRRAHLTADGVVGRRTARRLCPRSTCVWRGSTARTRPSRRLRRQHRVRPGETLTTISRRYGLSVGTIARVNRLNPQGILFAGARLHIPGSAKIQAARAAVQQPWTVRAALDYWSGRYGVDSGLVRAVAWYESGFTNHLTSSAGAMGVMQVTPATWDYVETVLVGHRIPHTMSGNVQVGVVFLRQLLREFGGDVRVALAGYAQGPSSVRTRGVLRETRQYVAGVLALQSRV